MIWVNWIHRKFFLDHVVSLDNLYHATNSERNSADIEDGPEGLYSLGEQLGKGYVQSF